MKHILICAADGAMASQLSGVIDFFMIGNRYWQFRNQTSECIFEVTVCSPTGEAILCHGGMTQPAVSIEHSPAPDVVFIIGGVAYNKDTLASYYCSIAPLGPFIKQLANDNIPIATFCSSTFVAAELGLLDNRNATTVWWLANLFNAMYPKVHLELDQLVTRDQSMFTAGATTSYLSLCLRIVEHLYDDHLAGQMSRVLLVEPNRCSQRPYMLMEPIERHSDDLVKSIQQWMGENLDKPIYLDQIAEKFAVTKRTLNRRFKKALNDTPVNYLQKLRVENAKRLLECSSMSLEQIVYKVGYEDTSSFRKLFIDIVEITPKEYRERFQSNMPTVPMLD